MVQEIIAQVSFSKHTLTKKDSGVVEGDYNSTKLIFEFDEDVSAYRVVFKMSNPLGELVLIKDLIDNEVMLAGHDEEGNVCSLFTAPGLYPFELVLYGDEFKLTSATGWMNVAKRQVTVGGGRVVEYYFPLFDEILTNLDKFTDAKLGVSQGFSTKYSITSPGWKRVLNLIRASGGILTMGVAKARAASGYSCQSLGMSITGNVNFHRVAEDTIPRIYQLFNHEMGENNSNDITRRARITKVRLGYPENGTDFPNTDGSVNYKTNPVNCYLDVYVDFEPQLEDEKLQFTMNFAGHSDSHNCETILDETEATGVGMYGETLCFHEFEVKRNADIYIPNGSLEVNELKASSADLKGYVKTTDRIAPEKYGIVRVPGLAEGTYGLRLNTAGSGLIISCANKTDINEKSSHYKPITPVNLEYAVTSIGDKRYAPIGSGGGGGSGTEPIEVAKNEYSAKHSYAGFSLFVDEDGGINTGMDRNGFHHRFSEDLGYGIDGEHAGAHLSYNEIDLYKQVATGETDPETDEPIYRKDSSFKVTHNSVEGSSTVRDKFKSWLNVPTDALRYSYQYLTEAQKTQVKQNLGIAVDSITPVEYITHQGDIRQIEEDHGTDFFPAFTGFYRIWYANNGETIYRRFEIVLHLENAHAASEGCWIYIPAFDDETVIECELVSMFPYSEKLTGVYHDGNGTFKLGFADYNSTIGKTNLHIVGYVTE